MLRMIVPVLTTRRAYTRVPRADGAAYTFAIQPVGIAMRLFRFAILALCACLLIACGNKGPLVLPDKKAPTTPAQPEKSQSQDSAKQP
jgi:predicted small lipoprotein YifL